MPRSTSPSSSPWRRLGPVWRDPLTHFLAVAVVLFGAKSCHDARARPVIELTRDQLLTMAQEYEQRQGKKPTRREWRETIDILVRDEVLFREAQARGLAADNRIRLALIDSLRATMIPVLPEPPEAELRAAYQRMPEDVRARPAQIAFEQIFFSARGQIPGDLLERLRQGASPTGFGESTRLPNEMTLTYLPQIERLLGAKFAEELFALPAGQWAGPVLSSQGAHLVRVTARVEAAPIPFEELRAMALTRWQQERGEEAVAVETAKLVSRYRIIAPEAPEEFPP